MLFGMFIWWLTGFILLYAINVWVIDPHNDDAVVVSYGDLITSAIFAVAGPTIVFIARDEIIALLIERVYAVDGFSEKVVNVTPWRDVSVVESVDDNETT
jgi:hypothetical protein